MKYILLFLISFNVLADQISYQESSRLTDTDVYYISMDRRIQYSFDNWFIQIRKSGVCPYYCGFNYNMIGLGMIKHKPVSMGMFFAQAGVYYVKNDLGHVKWDENIDYYLNARFQSMAHRREFESYEVKNDKFTFGITLGLDIPLTDSVGIKASYQYLKVKEIIIGYKTDPPAFPDLWWDPVHRDLSALNLGFYFNF